MTSSNGVEGRLKKGKNPYDIHCYWPAGDSGARSTALALREKIHSEFPWLVRCRVRERARGPHPQPYWEADFGPGNAERHAEVVAWLRENSQGLSILIHPHTTDGFFADHRPPNAMWIGEPIDLRPYFFVPYLAAVVAGAAIAVAWWRS